MYVKQHLEDAVWLALRTALAVCRIYCAYRTDPELPASGCGLRFQTRWNRYPWCLRIPRNREWIVFKHHYHESIFLRSHAIWG